MKQLTVNNRKGKLDSVIIAEEFSCYGIISTVLVMIALPLLHIKERDIGLFPT